MSSRRRSFVLAVLCLLSAVTIVSAAVPAPDVYDVQISYRIQAFRNERLLQYYEMLRFLKKAGFQRDPKEVVPDTEPEDVTATRMRGTIPAKQARLLLNERHIKSILLFPHKAKPPEDQTKPVRVHIELYSGLTTEGQRQLSDQTFEVLAGIQFRGAVGYDHRGFTRLIGSLPYNRLETLLTDLREQPAGKRLPGPFKNFWAVRIAEVLPDVPPPIPRPRPPQVPKEQEKLTPDLRDVLSDAAQAGKPMRLEVILAATPHADDQGYRALLGRAAPGLVVEGRLGPLVTVVVPADQAPALAASPDVTGVRLPRLPQSLRQLATDRKDPRWQPLLKASGAARLHALGHRGKGTRLAVVDSDFRGWEKLVGKDLPKDTRLIDLTRERNADLQPDLYSGGGQGPGPGTRQALLIARVAPEVSLTLIRMDAAAPYMLEAVARAINGDSVRSINLDNRLEQLEREQALLDIRRGALREERRRVLDDFRQEGEIVARRKAYFEKQKAFDQDEARHYVVLNRYLQFQRDMRSLRGIRVVASALSWSDGFPVDGTSTLSRYFDERPFRAALWFQAAGDTRGQSWTGLFHDADGNGVMEFAAPGQRLPTGTWTRELNFLSWRTPTGKTGPEIPANTRFRITLQWREAHDPLYQQTGEDPYRQPLANLRVLLLHQLDPSGARQPADDLEVIPLSLGAAQRLDASANAATYEQTLQVQLKKPGRYAVRIEGRVPETIYPPGDTTLPSMRKQGELRLRLFVTPLDGTGRAIFRDYVTDTGNVGMPADARTAITVGAADARNQRQRYSVGGAPFNVELLTKPDVLAYDLGQGTAEAAAFAAGLAALDPNASRNRTACLEGLRALLRLPDERER